MIHMYYNDVKQTSHGFSHIHMIHMLHMYYNDVKRACFKAKVLNIKLKSNLFYQFDMFSKKTSQLIYV